MKQVIVLSWIIVCMISGIDAQSFRTTSLSKGGIYTNTSLLQDYDNDGDLDIIVTSTEATPGFSVGIYWLENEPTQQFPKRAIVTENITRIADLDLADFDGDGDIDYLVSSMASVGSKTNGELVWFQRQDNGTYIKWTIETDAEFVMADVADFNGDGRPDVTAVGLIAANDDVRVYLNQGDLFFNKITPAKDDIYGSVDAADIDKDGDIDIVVGGSGLAQNHDGSRLLINDGKANFKVGAELHCYGDSYNDCGHKSIKIDDINGDGVMDILAFNLTGTSGLYWLNGAKNFDQKLIDDDNTIDLGGDFVVFDIDGNGKKDIVRQGYGKDRVSVLYQTGDMVFRREYIETNWDNGGNPSAKMAVGDLDGDKDLDLIFPEQGNIDGDLSWFENINGKLFRHLLYSDLIGARIPKFADVDKDGDQDIFLTVSSSEFSGAEEDEAILYENIGNNHFINWRLSDSLDYAADIEPADIDGDGDLDVFASARDANDLVWLRNNGIRSSWTKTVIDANINQVLGISAVDLDGDKDIDVVACSNNDDKVFWYRNDGKGVFSKLVVDANVDAPLEIEASDLDRDGDIDLALVCAGTTNTIVTYLNQGNQIFTKTIAFTSELGSDIEIADWDADNDPDILISIFNTSPVEPRRAVVALLNAGNGTFQVEEILIGSEGVRSLKVVDLDRDKDMDLLLGSNDRVLLEGWLRGSNRITDIKRVVLSENTSSNGNIYGIDVADVDNDGLNEIVFADSRNDALLMVKFDCFTGPAIKSSVTKASCGENNGIATITPSSSGSFTYKWSTGSTEQTISNLRTGIYQVSVTSFPGCTTSTSVVISRDPVASVTLLATPTTCDQKDGKIATGVQGGAPIRSYRWNTGDTIANLINLAGGMYSVTLTDTNNCKIIKDISVVAKSKPVFSLGKDTVLTVGKTLILNAKGNPNWLYQWSTGQTSTSIAVNSPGLYSVKVTNLDGCSTLDTILVKVATSARYFVDVADFKVSPNPAQQSIIIQTQVDKLQGAEFFIANSAGQIVQKGTTSFAGGRSAALDVSALPAGFYSLKLIKDEYRGAAKLLIVH